MIKYIEGRKRYVKNREDITYPSLTFLRLIRMAQK